MNSCVYLFDAFSLKVQEVPGEEFEVNDILIGPVLRIVCDEMVEFLKPVTITLPVSLGDTHHDFPNPTTCRVRILFLSSDGEQKEWLDITEDLKSPVTFDGMTVKFQVERFSGYVCLLIAPYVAGFQSEVSPRTCEPLMGVFVDGLVGGINCYFLVNN